MTHNAIHFLKNQMEAEFFIFKCESQISSTFQKKLWSEFFEEFPSHLKNSDHMHTAIPYRASTGPKQGFPCEVNSHRENPVFIAGNPYSHCRDPVFITGISLWEKLRRENPVFITGNGFAVHQKGTKNMKQMLLMVVTIY